MRKTTAALVALSWLFVLPGAYAEAYHPKRVTPKPEAPANRPFAEHFVVYHLSSGSEFEQRLVLNNASNMNKAYGPEKVAIEVVVYGPGLRLLFKENEKAARIKGLAANGVRFSACSNTMKAMGRQEQELVDVAQPVKGGVLRLVELQEAGWSYIRP